MFQHLGSVGLPPPEVSSVIGQRMSKVGGVPKKHIFFLISFTYILKVILLGQNLHPGSRAAVTCSARPGPHTVAGQPGAQCTTLGARQLLQEVLGEAREFVQARHGDIWMLNG